GDKDLDVRMETILALGELGPTAKDAAQPLLDLAKDEDFALLEPMLGVALGSLGRPAVDMLKPALADRDARKRRLAAYALATLGADAVDAATALVDALNDSEAPVRASAAM